MNEPRLKALDLFKVGTVSLFRGESIIAATYNAIPPLLNSGDLRMGHTYTNLGTHIVFSTKDRLPYIRDERRDDVFTYIGGIVRNLKGTPINVNGAADHVHALIRLPAALAVAKTAEILAMDS